MLYIYTIKFHSAVQKDEIVTFAGKWIELEIIMLSEISQSHKVSCFLSYVESRGKIEGNGRKRGTML
jgi:hypothetical protein